MISVRANKEFDLNFKVHIQGSDDQPQTRFVFEMAHGINVSFPGIYDSENEMVEVSLPTLSSMGLFEQTEAVNAKLEIIVEGNYFVPWKDQVTIKQPIKISAESIETETESLEEAVSAVENTPTITYREEKKFSPVENLKKLKRDKKGVFTEEIINGVIHRKYKK